jgi:chromosome segregation ATPase
MPPGQGGGPAIRLHGPWLASAQQASKLEAQANELHLVLAQRDAHIQALQQRSASLDTDHQQARAALAAVSAELHAAEHASARAREEVLRERVERHTLALDLPYLEGSHGQMLKHYHTLQAKWQAAEHAR